MEFALALLPLVFSPLETLAPSLACCAIFENGKDFLFRREGPAEGRVTGSEAAIQSTEKPSSSLLNSMSGCECNTGKELTSSIALDLVLSPSTSTYCKLVPGACWTLKSLL